MTASPVRPRRNSVTKEARTDSSRSPSRTASAAPARPPTGWAEDRPQGAVALRGLGSGLGAAQGAGEPLRRGVREGAGPVRPGQQAPAAVDELQRLEGAELRAQVPLGRGARHPAHRARERPQVPPALLEAHVEARPEGHGVVAQPRADRALERVARVADEQGGEDRRERQEGQDRAEHEARREPAQHGRPPPGLACRLPSHGPRV
jgi:hypothetical protein